MSTIIDTLIVALALDPAGVVKGRKQTEDEFKRTRDSVRKTGGEIEQSSKNAALFLSKLRTEVISLFAAFTAGKGLVDFVASVVKTDADVGRLAKTLDETTEELSTWRSAAALAGGSADGITASIQGLVGQFQQFTLTGESSVIPYFRALGVTITDSSGHMRDMSDILLDLSDRFQGMDPARAAVIGRALGFDQGTINMLVQGRAAVRAYLDEARRAGIITKEDAIAGADLQRRWNELSQASTSAGRAILTLLAPALILILKGITAVAEFLLRHKPLLVAVFAVLTTAVIGLSTAMVVNLATTAIGAVAGGFAILAGGASELMLVLAVLTETALPALSAAFLALGAAIEVTPVGWIITAIAALAVAGYELYEHWDEVKSWWTGLWSDIQAAPARAVPKIAQLVNFLANPAGALGGLLGSYLSHQTKTSPAAAGGAPLPSSPRSRASAPAGGAPRGGRSGGSREADDVAALMGMGWSREAAIGIAANIQRESGDKGAGAVGDYGHAYGLGQWHADRRAAFERWAGHSMIGSSRAEQLAFINYELRQGSDRGARLAGQALGSVSDARTAAKIVSRLYERPKDREGEQIIRSDIASSIATALSALAAAITNQSKAASVSRHSTHIGSINIHTKATDSKGIARSIGGALRNDHSLASQANYGLQG